MVPLAFMRRNSSIIKSPLFSGCLFVAGNVSEVTLLASLQKAAILVNNEGKSLSIEACKAELPAKFAQLLKL